MKRFVVFVCVVFSCSQTPADRISGTWPTETPQDSGPATVSVDGFAVNGSASAGVGGGDADAGADAGSGNGGGSDGGPTSPCAYLPNGMNCGTDALQAERCWAGVCAGTYVSPWGSDFNPGTRASPKRTLAAALQQATRFAAIPAIPTTVGVYAAAGNYAEDVVMPNYVDLQGGFHPSTWERDLALYDAFIFPADPRGVRFADAAMTSTTSKLSGFIITGRSGVTNAAVTVSAGAKPELTEVDLFGGAVQRTESRALVVDGAGSRPLVTRSLIVGGSAVDADPMVSVSSYSHGVLITNGGSIELARSTSRGGPAELGSMGVFCERGCPGASFSDATLEGGDAANTYGLAFWGNVAGVTVTRVAARGGVGYGHGVFMNACSGSQVTISQSTLSGVMVGNSDARWGVGLGVSDGCHVQLTHSKVYGVRSGVVESATGIHCNHRTQCDLSGNEIWAAAPGASANEARAISLSSFGAVGTIARNFIRAGACLPAGEATGVRLQDTDVVLENNVIIGGDCESSRAVQVDWDAWWGENTSATPLGQPKLINNHLDGAGVTGLGSSYGILIENMRDNYLPHYLNGPYGIFVNNTIIAGRGLNGAAVSELHLGADPLELRNNNLIGNGLPLYKNENAMLMTIAEVNEIASEPMSSGNISADPLIVGGGDFHLQATSPNRGAGTALRAPMTDFDSQPRPSPSGTNPDIGPDERN